VVGNLSQRRYHERRALRGDSLLILSLYNIIVCLVAAALYVAVNNIEPNRRNATALKLLIIALAVVAILAHFTEE
jgi:hypothetical protein